MAVYIVHASLLLIFAGGIIDGVFGYSGFMALQSGQASDQIELRQGGTKQIPFAVKCNGAGQENYADGSPKRWWSKLAVVKNGHEIEAKEIVVNDPLVHQGLRFYQASFGTTGKLSGLKVAVSPDTAGSSTNASLSSSPPASARELTLPFNQLVQLDANTTVTTLPSTFPTSLSAITRSSSALTIR